jgi:hypothetical protein
MSIDIFRFFDLSVHNSVDRSVKERTLRIRIASAYATVTYETSTDSLVRFDPHVVMLYGRSCTRAARIDVHPVQLFVLDD